MSSTGLCSLSVDRLMRFETHDYYSYRIRNAGLLELQVLQRWSIRIILCELWGSLCIQDLKCRTVRTKELKNVGLLQLQDLKCRSFRFTGIERGNVACIFPAFF